MSGWTSPKTQSPGDAVLSADWNTHIRDNLVALKAPPSDRYVANEGANYTNAVTSFVDVDVANFNLSIATFGGDVMIGVVASVSNSNVNGHTFIDVLRGVARVGGDDGIIVVTSSTANARQNVSFVYLLTGLGAAAYTFKLQWKVSGGTSTMFAGAGTGAGDVHPQFWVREVS